MSQEEALWEVDLDLLFTVIDELYREGFIEFPAIRSTDEAQMIYSSPQEEIQTFYGHVLITILKNRKILISRKSSTLVSSAIYATSKKLGIRITYRNLFWKTGATECAVMKIVKQLEI